MLRLWTNGLYEPTLHRVLVHGGSSRVSAPFFYEPAYGARVAPLLSPEWEHLASRAALAWGPMHELPRDKGALCRSQERQKGP